MPVPECRAQQNIALASVCFNRRSARPGNISGIRRSGLERVTTSNASVLWPCCPVSGLIPPRWCLRRLHQPAGTTDLAFTCAPGHTSSRGAWRPQALPTLHARCSSPPAPASLGRDHQGLDSTTRSELTRPLGQPSRAGQGRSLDWFPSGPAGRICCIPSGSVLTRWHASTAGPKWFMRPRGESGASSSSSLLT
jgi:hypothetical protein